jgi:putative tryptophan/tyrosine transport system substrate-binding protein
MMDRRKFVSVIAGSLLATPHPATAQATKIYRIGVVLQGGPYYQMVEGLRDGLKELGFVEGTQYLLHIRDTKGDLKTAEEAARNLEHENVDLILSIASSVSRATKRATEKVPIVFFAGEDPVDSGLVNSFAKPGGRVTGITSLSVDLTAKRLEILKALSPKLRRVVTFYGSANPVARESAATARRAAQQLGLEFDYREVRSVAELQAGLNALKTDEGEAIFLVSDAMVVSQTQLIADVAKAKKVPTMFSERSAVVGGGLASYGVSYYAVGRLAAKYVHRMLLGANPADLPVERFDRFELVINIKTAKVLGLTIPQSLLLRADEVIQ